MSTEAIFWLVVMILFLILEMITISLPCIMPTVIIMLILESGKLLSVGYECRHFFGAHGERVFHEMACMGIILEILYLASLGFKLLGSIESDIGITTVKQLMDIFLINLATLTLTIGTVAAAKRHTFVELNSKPAERFDYIFLSSGNKAIRIGILYPEHQIATMLTGKKIIKQCCADSSNMKSSGRTRRKTHPYFSL